jgi:hypothetical protein
MFIMTIDGKFVFVAVHVLCMLGAFGGVLIVQYGLPKDVRDTADTARSAGRLPTLLLAVGFLAGLIAYWLNIHYAANSNVNLPSIEHAIIGIKFLFLVAAGAFMGITAKALKQADTRRANFFRGMTLVPFVLAACLGLLL